MTTKSVAKALDILEILCKSGDSLDLHEISDELALPSPTVYRLLQTLAESGYARQEDSTRKYAAGLRIFELSQAIIDNIQFTDLARVALRRLTRETEETVHLAVLDQSHVIYLQKHESSYPAALHSRVGRRAPAHCTGVGKLLLAYLPEPEREAFLESAVLEPFTTETITDSGALKAELARIRQQGYSLDNMEHEEGVYCIACPIRDHTQEVMAAVSITTTSLRMEMVELLSYLPTLRETVGEISRELGYVEPGETVSEL